jgi:hypothetical protein
VDRRLSEGRPQPSDEFLATTLGLFGASSQKPARSRASHRVGRLRVVAAVALTAGLAAVVASLGAGSFAGDSTVGAVQAVKRTFDFSGGSTGQRSFLAASCTYSMGLPYEFVVDVASPETAGVAFNVTLTATACDASGNPFTDTNYSGTHSITFTGPLNSPNGTQPSYSGGPVTVTFTGGVGTASITLYDATSSTTLHATEGALTGFTSFAVNSGGAGLSFGTPCPSTSMANKDTWTSTVVIGSPDIYGNATLLASPGVTITVALGGSGANHWSLNGASGPTSVSLTTTSSPTTSFLLTHTDNGAGETATVTASGPTGFGYTAASCVVNGK